MLYCLRDFGCEPKVTCSSQILDRPTDLRMPLPAQPKAPEQLRKAFILEELETVIFLFFQTPDALQSRNLPRLVALGLRCAGRSTFGCGNRLQPMPMGTQFPLPQQEGKS